MRVKSAADAPPVDPGLAHTPEGGSRARQTKGAGCRRVGAIPGPHPAPAALRRALFAALAACIAGCQRGPEAGPARPGVAVGVRATAAPIVPPAPPPPGAKVETIARDGIVVEVVVTPARGGARAAAAALHAGDDVALRVRVNDANGRPLSGVRPRAWFVPGRGDATLRPPALNRRVASLVNGDRLAPPEMDFNRYYVIALNDDATVTVVDPLAGFGGTKLLALVALPGPGEDWVLAPDGRRLYVSVPTANRVVVIDSVVWTVATEAQGLPGATHLALQADGHHLWVDTDEGVAVIETDTMKVAARFATGRGPHEIALDPDDRRAYVTNRGSKTLTVVDARRLVPVADLDVGPDPVSVAYSSSGRAAYVANGLGDTVAVVGGDPPAVTARVAVGAGASSIRFAPGGRLAFVTHPERDLVSVVDASVNRVVRTIEALGVPDQVAFSDRLAYIRPRESPMVRLVPLDGITGGGNTTTVLDVPGGQHPLGQGSAPCAATAIAGASGEGTMLIGNPADKAIYYYKEGMSAPSGSFRNASRAPLAVLAVDRSLRAIGPGVFEAVARLRNPGDFDVVVLLDSPRFAHAFGLYVADTPGRPPAPPAIEVRPDPADTRRVASPRAGTTHAGPPYDVRAREPQADCGADRPPHPRHAPRPMAALRTGCCRRQGARCLRVRAGPAAAAGHLSRPRRMPIGGARVPQPLVLHARGHTFVMRT